MICFHINFLKFPFKTFKRSMASSLNLRNVLILTKTTRYEFEKKRNKCLNDDQLRQLLSDRGSNLDSLLLHHKTHHENLDKIIRCFSKRQITAVVVTRPEYESLSLEPFDAIFTAGGDGTYLLAANKVRTAHTPVIGINTDSTNSEGYLCLPSKYTRDFGSALDRIQSADFKWLKRNRISVTLSGINLTPYPVKLHDQQLSFPEYRFAEHFKEYEMHLQKLGTLQEQAPVPVVNGFSLSNPSNGLPKIRTIKLPDLALNEIFIGESLSSRVSYYELSIDGGPLSKQKSSGLTVCTGTGSSSWSFNINKIPLRSVQELLNIANERTGNTIDTQDEVLMRTITDDFNDKLIFSPEESRMAYTIRDPVINNICSVDRPRGFAQNVTVRSRCWDACVVIDGGYSFAFNDGAIAEMSVHPDNALLTIAL